ncbi:TetR/AcrR family transcriptional regulator [Nocardia sp. NPDC049707]|uniref:TetR/AcrR family transcriptional regulator n=1 Tax=Nocardia sp. NPDC049707 TaxID=3154735 RepID=UPI00343610DE
MSAESATGVRRRPPNRKEQILESARTLIVEGGSRNVSMAQIASRVGITAGALYRHFANKAVLIEAVIEASFDEVSPTFGQGRNLSETLGEVCSLAATRREVGALWWQEAGSLPIDARTALRDRLRWINQRYAELIRIERPDLPDGGPELLAWGIQSLLASTSSYKTRMSEPEFSGLLTAACWSLCHAQVAPPRRRSSERGGRLEPVSKRERLLGHAIELFGENGYDMTGLDDIGTAAGVTGPNLYSYFESKSEILEAAVERATAALWLLLHGVLRQHDDPRAALTSLVSGYVELALDRTILTSVLQADRPALSDSARAREREYVAEWTALLQAARPDLAGARARVLVHSALGVIHAMARIDHLRDNTRFPDGLAAIALAVLFAA